MKDYAEFTVMQLLYILSENGAVLKGACKLQRNWRKSRNIVKCEIFAKITKLSAKKRAPIGFRSI